MRPLTKSVKMIDIAIDYPFLFFKRKATGKAPTSWDELTEQQFIAISRTIHGAEPDFRFLSILTGIGKNLLKKLTPVHLLRLSEQVEFIGKAGNVHSEFIINQIAGYVCPKPKLNSLTFGQFIFADSHYNDWQSGKRSKALNNLIASLYLLPGEKFDNETIPERAAIISSTDPDIRRAIAFNYGLILKWIAGCYPLLFNSSEEDVVGANDIRPKQSGWLKLFESLVGDDLINRDRYAEIPIHTVFRYLTTKYKENAKQS